MVHHGFVAGADSAVAAILAAALTVLVDAVAVPGTSLLVVGLLAALLGRLPRGIAGLFDRARGRYRAATGCRAPTSRGGCRRTGGGCSGSTDERARGRRLTKSYGGLRVLDGVSLRAEAGASPP